MVRRKKAKANASNSRLRRKVNVADMEAESEISASTHVMTEATVEDGVVLLNNEEDVNEVGGCEDIEAKDSACEENANKQRLEQRSGFIATDSMNSEEYGKEEAVDKENVNEHCFVENFENIAMEIINCDAYCNNEEIDVELLNMDNAFIEGFVTPNEENEVKVLAEENILVGCFGEGNGTVTLRDDVEGINEENSVFEKNCGECANEDEERIPDETEQEGDEEDYEEVEEEGAEENVQSNKVDEEDDKVDDEVDEEEDMADDEVDDIHLEEEIHKTISDKNGDKEHVVENGNSQEDAKEQHLEGEEVMVEAGVNNIRNEVDETPEGVEIDRKTADCSRDKKVIALEVNCQGVVKESQEKEIEKIKTQKTMRSRKRIKTSTIMTGSTDNLALKIHDEPKGSQKEKLKQGVDGDLKEQKNVGEDVPNIDNDKNNVVYGNKGKQKVGIELKDSGGEKVPLDTEKEVGESSKKKRKRSKQKSRDALVQGSLVKVASKSEGKSGLSSKKNSSSKAATEGMIFMCSSKTKQDCYRYMVLGLPAGKRELVEKIHKGMILFLYDVDKKLLNGIYKAAANGGYDLEPKAFNSKFPAQVRFEILEGFLPLEEEKFSEAIRDNYYTRSKFDCQLSSEQVENLCELFRASVKDVKSDRKRSHRAVKSGIKQRQQEREEAKAKVKEAQAKFSAESHEVRRPRARKERHHRKRPLVHNEDSSFPRRPIRLSQATASSYVYEGPLRREAYRGEPSVPRHEIYREQHLLEPRDTYRRDLLLDRRGTYSPDPYLEHRTTSRQDRMLVPGDLYRVGQPQLQPRDPYRQYPVLERRDYNLKPLAEHLDYDLEPLAERRDSYLRQGLLLNHQDLYRKDPALERQSRQELDLEPIHSSIRAREDVLLSRRDYSAYSGGVYSTVQQLDLEPTLSNRRRGEDVLLSREDQSAYSGGLYSSARPLRASMLPVSRAVGLTTLYPSPEAEPRYYSHRPLYQL